MSWVSSSAKRIAVNGARIVPARILLTMPFSPWNLAGWNSARTPVQDRNVQARFDAPVPVYGGPHGLPALGGPTPRAYRQDQDVSQSRLCAPADRSEERRVGKE